MYGAKTTEENKKFLISNSRSKAEPVTVLSVGRHIKALILSKMSAFCFGVFYSKQLKGKSDSFFA